MSPKHTVCFCNNRGGVGKTFMAFQTACEAARSRPDKRVLVIDFSLYSDQTALLLGGSARESFGAPMKGLQVTVDVTTCDTRAEGLIRDLEHAPDAMDCDEDRPASSSIFGTFFSRKRKTTSPGTKTPPGGGGPVDLTRYALRPHDHNPAIPPNLYLIPSAGATSWADTQSDHASEHGYADPPEETQIPLWARRGDGWLFAARKLRVALDALPDDFGAVFVDTDHLAACVLTKLALASCEKVIVPLSFDDGDFNRLFQDVTGNALFTDVMVPMRAAGVLAARVNALVFTKVASTKNEAFITEGGIRSPFKPSATVMAQMDAMARQVQSACQADERYAKLFYRDDDAENSANVSEAKTLVDGPCKPFREKYFSAMKLVPDLAANISKMCGLPICAMTSEKYVAPSGLSGQSAKPVLDGLKAEIRDLAARVLDDAYHAPIDAS
jgi:cellulose biosynthesis protein BcsQ